MALLFKAKEIRKCLELMLKYQKENNITKECLTNVQYVYDMFKCNINGYFTFEAIPVMCIGIRGNDVIIVKGHLVLKLEDRIIDPSYEICSMDNVRYYDNIKTFFDALSLNEALQDFVRKDVVTTFLTFKSFADQINSGGLVISNKTFYNNQADYIEANCNALNNATH